MCITASLPPAAQERAAKTATQQMNAEQHTHHLPLRQSAAPERIAPPPPTPSGAAAVQRGEQRIQGGSRGNSQSPYPSLAAGGCHAAALSSTSGARTLPQMLQSIINVNKRPITLLRNAGNETPCARLTHQCPAEKRRCIRARRPRRPRRPDAGRTWTCTRARRRWTAPGPCRTSGPRPGTPAWIWPH